MWNVAGPLPVANVSLFPIIMTVCFTPVPDFPLVLAVGLCLTGFQSAVREQQLSQNVSVSWFLSCQQLTFPFHSVIIFQVLCSIL